MARLLVALLDATQREARLREAVRGEDDREPPAEEEREAMKPEPARAVLGKLREEVAGVAEDEEEHEVEEAHAGLHRPRPLAREERPVVERREEDGEEGGPEEGVRDAAARAVLRARGIPREVALPGRGIRERAAPGGGAPAPERVGEKDQPAEEEGEAGGAHHPAGAFAPSSSTSRNPIVANVAPTRTIGIGRGKHPLADRETHRPRKPAQVTVGVTRHEDGGPGQLQRFVSRHSLRH